MDLYAYYLKEYLEPYATKHYGEIPRCRGIRLMKLEKPQRYSPNDKKQMEIFNEYCGQDVIYVHTRCGQCDEPRSETNNYNYCGGKEFEERNKDTFLKGVDDTWDSTYRDHYFKAVINDEYNELLKQLEDIQNRSDEE